MMTPEKMAPSPDGVWPKTDGIRPRNLVVAPRIERAEAIQRKCAEEKRGPTQEEQRMLILALPRKVRRKHKIRTTDIREILDALAGISDASCRRGGGTEYVRKARNKAKAKRRKMRKAGQRVGVG